ncbi:MAG: ferredoxin [Pseudonocardia sp. SCN 72-86]|nr:MAG: ferredoxin [Pseudonocardia sp. SCN 72-86]
MTSTVVELEMDLVLASRVRVAEDVVHLVLKDPSGRHLPRWGAGAHIDLLVGGQTRQYSLCGDPSDRSGYEIAVLHVHDGRGGSAHIHDELTVGDTVRVRGPRNHFALNPSPAYRFVAGGIGITPLLPMIARAEAQGADWQLVYGGRSLGSMAFAEELRSLGDRVVLWPQDERGLIDLAAAVGAPAASTLVYCCGPEPLLAAVEQHCAGWPAGSLHVERFAKRSQDGAPEALTEFEVELRQSELVLQVPEDRSILEVLEDADVDVFSSCLEGVCGSCETPVVEGVPDHRDSVLSAEDRAAGKFMMVCVSRSCSRRLVLDI